MSTTQSNLSGTDCDLVVAVTQDAVNSGLAYLLSGLDDSQAPVVTICYVFDHDNNLTPIEHQALITAASGSDPFQVKQGADPYKDPDLQNLWKAGFAAAVRAQIGLPDVDPKTLPPIVTLVPGADTVLFNLLCSQFRVTGLQYGPTTTWVDNSELSGDSTTPWYLSAQIALATGPPAVTRDELPKKVGDRLATLQDDVGEDAFTLQRLFLDLDTAILYSTPTIVGPQVKSSEWQLLVDDFLGAYFTQLRNRNTQQKNESNPVLGYTFTVNEPDRESTVQLGAISRECVALLDSSGTPIANPIPQQAAASSLVYLGSTSTTAPKAQSFGWNWLEETDTSSFSGVVAVRSGVFLSFLESLVNQDIGDLSYDTSVHMSHTGETIWIDYSHRPAATPAVFRPVSPVTGPDADGFTTVLEIDYRAVPSHDHAATASKLVQVWGDYDYAMSGDVAVGGTKIRLRVRGQVYMTFAHDETALKNYQDLPGANYGDLSLTAVYDLQVDTDGALQPAFTHKVDNNSAPWAFTPGGLLGKMGVESQVQKGLQHSVDDLDTTLNGAFSGYAEGLGALLSGAGAWVFPGGNAFTFSHAGFSDHQDLVVQATYIDPT